MSASFEVRVLVRRPVLFLMRGEEVAETVDDGFIRLAFVETEPGSYCTKGHKLRVVRICWKRDLLTASYEECQRSKSFISSFDVPPSYVVKDKIICRTLS